uniref:Deoxyribonuclease IV n=1 Tax=candidate division WOR-3 bacterium TaxID=2052148 RepID=A0A7C4YF00_UNCW3
MRFGFHLSISGGFKNVPLRMIEGTETFQIFPSNPRGWSKKPIEEDDIKEFKKLIKERNIKDFVVHSTYLPKLNTKDKNLRKKSVIAIKEEIERTVKLGGKYFVIHLGVKSGEKEYFKESLQEIVTDKTMILLENTSYIKIKDIGDFLREFKNVGFCFDTAHAFEAGYDLRKKEKIKELLNEINDNLPLEMIKVIHLNDSMTIFNSNVDRHYHIGRGFIGISGFIRFFEIEYFTTLPIIMETPEGEELDRMNLKAAKFVESLLKDGKDIS